MRSRLPLLMVKLATVTLPLVTGSLVTLTMMTWSVAAGTPLGVQFAAVPQAVLLLPSHVRVVWACAITEEMATMRSGRRCFMIGELNGRSEKREESCPVGYYWNSV